MTTIKVQQVIAVALSDNYCPNDCANECNDIRMTDVFVYSSSVLSVDLYSVSLTKLG